MLRPGARVHVVLNTLMMKTRLCADARMDSIWPKIRRLVWLTTSVPIRDAIITVKWRVMRLFAGVMRTSTLVKMASLVHVSDQWCR